MSKNFLVSLGLISTRKMREHERLVVCIWYGRWACSAVNMISKFPVSSSFQVCSQRAMIIVNCAWRVFLTFSLVFSIYQTSPMENTCISQARILLAFPLSMRQSVEHYTLCRCNDFTCFPPFSSSSLEWGS